MNKFKYFAFLAAVMVMTLLTLGSQKISAQASRTRDNDATPIPTNMPVDDSSVQGMIPSTKEQRELESVVRAYIDLRYRAFSVANTKGLAQDSFGSLISETPQAATFLSEELSKLVVEVERADTYHLRYVDYKYSLDFHSMTVDPVAQTATILVTEGNEVVYEALQELNPAQPLVSSARRPVEAV